MIISIEPLGNDGVTQPAIAPFQSIFTNESSYKNESPMTDTKAIIHFSIIRYEFVYSIIITKIVTINAPARIGILNNMCKAMAPPRISAREVEMDASMADDNKSLEYDGLR